MPGGADSFIVTKLASVRSTELRSLTSCSIILSASSGLGPTKLSSQFLGEYSPIAFSNLDLIIFIINPLWPVLAISREFDNKEGEWFPK